MCSHCRDVKRAASSRRRARCLAGGVCKCGKESDKGSLRCATCRERRRDLRLEHLCRLGCVLCGLPLESMKYRQCQSCRLKHRVRVRDWRAKSDRRPDLIVPVPSWRWHELTGEFK